MPESSPARPLDPGRLVRALADHGVRYVLVGALAARLNGFPRVTADADITPARDTADLERLAAALRALDMRYRPTGVSGHDELEREAERFDAFGVTLLVAPLQSILRMKEAADRPKDRQDAAVIRAMIDRDGAPPEG